MQRKKPCLLATVGSLAVLTISCQATEAVEKGSALRAAIAFYKAIEESSPELEKVMELEDYRLFGYPALIFRNLPSVTWGVEKLTDTAEPYEVKIDFWCKGDAPGGGEKKLRRTMLVRLAPDPAAAEGWSVARFKFTDDQELTIVRQFFTWLLWMFLAPLAFYLALLILAGGFLWYRVAFLVAYLLGMPLRIYVSYLWSGTAWAAAGAMIAWIFLEMMLAKKNA